MKDFMGDPKVLAALRDLRAALNDATGQRLKNMVVLASDTAADGTAGVTGLAFHGCECELCNFKLLITLATHFGMETELTNSDGVVVDELTSAVKAARGVH